jgi:hypothetical protein
LRRNWRSSPSYIIPSLARTQVATKSMRKAEGRTLKRRLTA